MGFRHTAEESARGNGSAAADARSTGDPSPPLCTVPRPRRGRGHRNGSLPRRGRSSKARRRGLRRLLSRLPPPLVGGLLDPMRGAQVPSQRKGVREPPVTFRTLQPLGASRSVRRHAGGPYPWQRDQTIADGREHATEVLHQSPLRLRHQLSLVLEPQLFPSEPLHREQQSVSHSGCLVPPGSGIRLPQSYTIPLWHTTAPTVVDHSAPGLVRRASLATENVTVAYRSRESAASGEVIRECREATGPSTVPAPQCHQSRPSRGPRFPRTACRTLARIMREQMRHPNPAPSLSEREGAVPEQRAG